MEANSHTILVVGPHELFPAIFDYLEANENYDLRYTVHFEFARALLREYTPDAILLVVPGDKQNNGEALAWLETLKNLASVLVLSTVVDTNLYITAMELGAFDLLTPETPPEGIDWILRRVIRRDVLAAA